MTYEVKFQSPFSSPTWWLKVKVPAYYTLDTLYHGILSHYDKTAVSPAFVQPCSLRIMLWRLHTDMPLERLFPGPMKREIRMLLDGSCDNEDWDYTISLKPITTKRALLVAPNDSPVCVGAGALSPWNNSKFTTEAKAELNAYLADKHQWIRRIRETEGRIQEAVRLSKGLDATPLTIATAEAVRAIKRRLEQPGDEQAECERGAKQHQRQREQERGEEQAVVEAAAAT
jgi:hypothetical protein